MNLLPSLLRPQYMVAPEILLSSLAARAYSPLILDDKEIGRTYRKNNLATNNTKVREFYPREQALSHFDLALKERGIVINSDDNQIPSDLVADAVRHSILGTKSLRSNTQAAAPLTPSLAMLQDLPGMLNKSGPADIGKILEQIYQLGAPASYSGPSAASRLSKAYSWRLKKDAFLQIVEKASASSILNHSLDASGIETISALPGASELYFDTPFTWFHKNWNKITSEEWSDALPARVWVDWATTVLRLGIGMSFLWEASWVHSIISFIQQGKNSSKVALTIRDSMSPPLGWESEELPIGMRNVASILKQRVKSAHGLREVLREYSTDFTASDCLELAEKYESDKDLQNKIIAALQPSERTGKNTWEAVSYTLTGRDSVDEFVDYYGLLRRRGPSILLPSPGVEWTTVIASLTCGRDRDTCDAGEILDELQSLGARPRLQDLIGHLEAAGLARGSADADRGVRVERAF